MQIPWHLKCVIYDLQCFPGPQVWATGLVVGAKGNFHGIVDGLPASWVAQKLQKNQQHFEVEDLSDDVNFSCLGLPSRSLTVRRWKVTFLIGKLSSTIIFQKRAVQLQGFFGEKESGDKFTKILYRHWRVWLFSWHLLFRDVVDHTTTSSAKNRWWRQNQDMAHHISFLP